MRLIKHDGKVRVTKLVSDSGRVAGYRVEHKDGRVDGVACPDTIRVKARRDG